MKYSNLELEQQFIASALVSETQALKDIDLTEEDFTEAIHWELFNGLRSGKKYRDYATHPEYEYIKILIDGAFAPILPGNGCEDILKELSRKRKLYSAMMDGIDSLESSDSAEVLSFLNSTINATAETPKLKTRTQVREEIARALELPKACYPTPFKELNIGMGGGLYEGFTYGFCGAEKAGKTTIAHTISNRLDCPHLYIAMEMGAKQIEERNVAKELQMNSLRFLEQPDGLKNKIEQMEARDNVIYLDAPGADLEEVLHNIGMAKIKYGIKGFILDYWQLVTGQQRGESEEKHLRNVAQSMANYARKHGLWCILLAQMNQDGKLFGGNGLKKACDQLYMIEDCGEYMENSRWLRMDASRYTMKADIGSEQSPALSLNTKVGPCFEDYAV